jgi:hypothetical protein
MTITSPITNRYHMYVNCSHFVYYKYVVFLKSLILFDKCTKHFSFCQVYFQLFFIIRIRPSITGLIVIAGFKLNNYMVFPKPTTINKKLFLYNTNG